MTEMWKKPTFDEMQTHTFDVLLAAIASVKPDIRRQFIAKLQLGHVTRYVVVDHGNEVFASDNWREALIEFNDGDWRATQGTAISDPSKETR
jgi:hypothetical protein